MGEIAKDAFSHVSLFIRVVATGWVSLGLLVLLDSSSTLRIFEALQEDTKGTIALVAAGLCGGFAYALYMALFENLFLRLVIGGIRRFAADEIPVNLTGQSTRQIIRKLYCERKARYAARNRRVREIQRRLDNYYAWLVFLYCTGLQFVACTIVVSLHRTMWQEWAWAWAAVAATSTLVVAICADVFISRVELWLVAQHEQLTDRISSSSPQWF